MNKLNKLFFGFTLLAVAQAASAVPITGALEFFGTGSFTSQDGVGGNLDTGGDNDGYLEPILDPVTGGLLGYEGGPATGFDFGPVGSPANAPGFAVPAVGFPGTLGTFYNPIGKMVTYTDIDLNSLPQNEFSIALDDGVLAFEITSGQETDTNQPGTWDIGGNGFFTYTCNADAVNCENEQTNGTWSISNTGGSFVIGFNAVPAPSMLALFGLGLIGLGALRARRRA